MNAATFSQTTVNVNTAGTSPFLTKAWGPLHPTQISRSITVRFRTGNEVHGGKTGSSVSDCGRWLKHNGVSMMVTGYKVTCERCLETRSYTYLSDFSEDEREEFWSALAAQKAAFDAEKAELEEKFLFTTVEAVPASGLRPEPVVGQVVEVRGYGNELTGKNTFSMRLSLPDEKMAIVRVEGAVVLVVPAEVN